jgi:hypothetical protein
MDMSKVKQLISSGDLDPAQKAQLIRAQLQKFKDFVSVADDVLADVAEEGPSSTDKNNDTSSGKSS